MAKRKKGSGRKDSGGEDREVGRELLTSPWRGEVASRSEAGGGEGDNPEDDPTPATAPPTLPLSTSGLPEVDQLKSDRSRKHPTSVGRVESGAPGNSATERGQRRCGFIALIGAPNAGKSTLTNTLVGSKVAIVSRKVQTTRALLRGIAIVGAAQLVLMDTPGIFAPRRRLDRAMVTTAWGGAHDADIVVLLVDAKKGLDEEAEAILGKLGGVRQPKVLVLNKIDLADKPALLGLAETINRKAKFDATFMLSAVSGDGVEDLKAWLAAHAPSGPWHYPEDQVSDAPMRSLAAEITREKLFDRLHQELPYQATVETDSWKELRGGDVRIEQTIYVERESQRKIVLGAGGATIKAIGAAARREIAELAEQKVHLFLFVKVREGWSEDPERYRQMGIEFPKD
jgi:GTPase